MSLPLSIYKCLPRRMPLSLGFSKYALDFNGVDNRVDISAVEDDVDPQEGTIIAWFRVKDATVWGDGLGHFIIELRVNTNNNIGIWKAAANRFYARYKAGGVEKYGVTLNPVVAGWGTEWHWAALTWSVSADEVRGYVDGEPDNVVTSLGTWSGVFNGLGSIGARAVSPPDLFWDGLINEVLVYNRSLSQRELYYNMLNYHNPIRSWLIGWWSFEEGSGLTAYDRSGYGNDGSLLPADAPPIWTGVRKWEMRAEAGL